MRPKCADCLFYRPNTVDPDGRGECTNPQLRAEVGKLSNIHDLTDTANGFNVVVSPSFGCYLHTLDTDETI